MVGCLKTDALSSSRKFQKTLQVRNECLTRKPNGIVLDACVVKWDGYERLERVRDVYDRVRRAGVDG